MLAAGERLLIKSSWEDGGSKATLIYASQHNYLPRL